MQADDINRIGAILAALRGACNLSQTKLSRLSGVRRSSICDYESGKVAPDAATLARLLGAMGLSWSSLDRAGEFLEDIAADRSTRCPASSEGTAAGRAVRRAAALHLASSEFGAANARFGRSLVALALDAVEGHHERQHSPVVPRPSDRDAVPALWDEIKNLPLEIQQSLVRTEMKYRSWALCEHVCFESERVCAADPAVAIALGTISLSIAEECSGPPGWLCRLRAFAFAHLGNAWRAQGNLDKAEDAFAQVAVWWSVGPEADPAGLLDEAWLLALLASFRSTQRHLEEAEDFIRRALARNPSPRLRGRLLVLRSRVHEASGEWDSAIECLTEATPLSDSDQDPRLYLCIRHNLVWLLAQCGRAVEAKQLLPEAFDVSRDHGTFLDQMRLVWVAGRIAAELGDTEKAAALYLQARAVLAERQISFDTALISLDLAVLYADQGRMDEVKTIARSLVPVFQANDLPRETLAALSLFRQAAEKKEVTVEFAQRLVAYFHRARFNPEMRFTAQC